MQKLEHVDCYLVISPAFSGFLSEICWKTLEEHRALLYQIMLFCPWAQATMWCGCKAGEQETFMQFGMKVPFPLGGYGLASRIMAYTWHTSCLWPQFILFVGPFCAVNNLHNPMWLHLENATWVRIKQAEDEVQGYVMKANKNSLFPWEELKSIKIFSKPITKIY